MTQNRSHGEQVSKIYVGAETHNMALHLGTFTVCFVVAFALIRYLLDTESSGTVLQVIIGLISAHVISVVVFSFLPKKLLPVLHKKAVFVTGCDSGFGNGLAQRLDSLGVPVYAGCLFAEGHLAKELKQKTSRSLQIVQLDVTKDDEVEAALKYVKSTLGEKELFAIVNNAGIATVGEMEWHSLKDSQKVMDVNLFGQIRMVDAFLPLLKESKGRVVNVVSIAAYISLPNIVPYCMSKSASLSYSDGIRRELRKFSVSVHSIEPSFYATPILSVLETSPQWKNFPSDLKKLYGDTYFEQLQKRFRMIMYLMTHSCSEVYQVVDSLADAAIGSNPEAHYSPSLLCVFLYYCVQFTPSFILDLVYSMLEPRMQSL